MFRKLFLAATLTTSAGLLAQTQYGVPGQAAGAPQPTPGTVNVVTPGPNVYVVGSGLYGTGVYLGAPFPVAPSQNAVPPAAGTVGISYGAPAEYGAGYSAATPLYYSNAASPYYNATPVYVESGATVAGTGRQINDLGPSYYESTTGPAGPELSVAEVAAQYKAAGPHNVRTFTNADAQRLSRNWTVSGVIIATNIAPPATPTSPAENPASGIEKPEAAPPPAAAPPAPQPQASTEPATPSPASESGGMNALPATSSWLPLLGLVGLLTGSVGLWLTRLRR